MQIGLGQLGFSPSVFYDMTFDEFIAAARGMNELEDMRQRQEWERARWSATLALQPHTKKGSRIKPTDLIIFPWEKKQGATKNNKLLENAIKRMTNG